MFETYEQVTGAVPRRSNRDSRSRGMLSFVKSGTALADIDTENSCTAVALKSKRGRGGARNFAGRSSDCISRAQAENLIAAACHATETGLPLNRFITIHWGAAGVADEGAAKATGAFIKLVSDWLRTLGLQTAWIWVRENPAGKGSHVHIAIHVPAGVTLGRMQMRWLRRITGNSYRRGVIKTENIGRSSMAAISDPEGHCANLQNVIAYILKGSEPAASERLGLVLLKSQGTVVGRRMSTSQNIGQAARREFLDALARA